MFRFQPSITLRGTGRETVEEIYEKLKCDLERMPEDAKTRAEYFHDIITADMDAVRAEADLLALVLFPDRQH